MYAVVGTPKFYSIEPEVLGREIYWHRPPGAFERKYYVLENAFTLPQPTYWHRSAPFNVPKWYILNRTFPAPQPAIGGGWFNPPDPGYPIDRTDYEAIKKDDRDFLNILIMAIHGLDGKI